MADKPRVISTGLRPCGEPPARKAGEQAHRENRPPAPSITLPLSAAPVPVGVDALAEDVPQSLRVLVVEDNVDSCEMLRQLLVMWGHRVDCATDGLGALDKLRSGAFEVALVDIGLPGLDGYQVARRIRQDRGHETPFLMAMTGYGQPEDRRRAMDSGFDVHMIKPVEEQALRKNLGVAAERRRGKDVS